MKSIRTILSDFGARVTAKEHHEAISKVKTLVDKYAEQFSTITTLNKDLNSSLQNIKDSNTQINKILDDSISAVNSLRFDRQMKGEELNAT